MSKANGGETSQTAMTDIKAAAISLLKKEKADFAFAFYPENWNVPQLRVFLVPLGGSHKLELRKANGFQFCMVHVKPGTDSTQYTERLRSSRLVEEGMHIESGSYRKDGHIFRLGQKMQLRNLRSSTELNGMACTVQQYDQDTSHWLVQLHDGADEDEILVAPENLHAAGEEVGFTLYLDEVPMPKRPTAISSEDCEVFSQDFPTSGSQAETTWLGRFGQAADIFRLPRNPRAAYVQFQTHDAAAACVAAGVAAWSESERALNPSRKIGSGLDYRKQLVTQLSSHLAAAREATGFAELRICGQALPQSTNLESSRLHFLVQESSLSGSSPEDARMQLIQALQEPLMKLHESGGSEGKNLRLLYVSGLPESWNQERIEEYFAQHGELRCVRQAAVAKAGKRSALVAYRRAATAKNALAKVNGAEVEGHTLKVQLKADPRTGTQKTTGATGAVVKPNGDAKRKRDEESKMSPDAAWNV